MAKKAIAQCMAVLGSDEAEVKRMSKLRADENTPEGDFGLEIIDGAVDYADHAVERIHQTLNALMTFSFFGGKLVWLKNASFLSDSVMGRSEAVTGALEKLLAGLQSGLPDGTQFLLSAVDVDKRRTFYKSLGKVAKVEVFDKLDTSRAGWEEGAADLAGELARARGLEGSMDALALLGIYTGGDRRMMDGEMEKLDLYLGPENRRLTEREVRLLVPVSRAGVVFELGNAMAERDVHRSLSLLDQLLFQGESPVGIMLASVIPTVRNMLLVKDLMVRHRLAKPGHPFAFGKMVERLPESATSHLPRKKDGGLNVYGLGLAAVQVHRYSLDELKTALNACLAASVSLVTSGGEQRVVLSRLIVQITAPKDQTVAGGRK